MACVVHFPAQWVDASKFEAALRASAARRVRLNFEEGESGTMGYLNRMGFFDHLAVEVEVFPARPAFSAAVIHRGGNRAWNHADAASDLAS